MIEKSGVYIIANETNGKVYVGSSKDVSVRLSQHRIALDKGIHHSRKLQRAWAKYGHTVFTFKPVLFCPVGELLSQEQALIDRYEAATAKGYNCSPTAGSNLGTKFSDEARAMLSITRKGRPVKQEAREKLSAIAKGRRFTEEHRANISISAKKRASSEEGMALLAAHRRKSIPPEEIERRQATRSANRLASGWAPRVKTSCRRDIVCESCGKIFVSCNLKAKNCSRLCEQRSRRSRTKCQF